MAGSGRAKTARKQGAVEVDHFFERVGRVWPAGRRDLHWHVLPTPGEAAALAAPYAPLALTRPGLEGVPAEWLHCTLLHTVGLGRDDIDLEAVLAEAGAVARTLSPFRLTFDRPSVSTVGFDLSGWPGRPFTVLVDALTQVMAGTKKEFAPAPSRHPHLSLAYAADGAQDVDSVALRTALAAIEGPLSATVVVDRLHLVEQWHDGARIRWEPLAEVPLAHTPAVVRV